MGKVIPLTDEEVMLGLSAVKRGTAEQVASAIGRSRKVVLLRLRAFEDDGRAHICGWHPTPGEPSPIWAEGLGESVAKPPRSVTVAAWMAENADLQKRLNEARSRACVRAKMLARIRKDQRSGLDLWACPNLGALPMIPYARPA